MSRSRFQMQLAVLQHGSNYISTKLLIDFFSRLNGSRAFFGEAEKPNFKRKKSNLNEMIDERNVFCCLILVLRSTRRNYIVAKKFQFLCGTPGPQKK